MAAVKPMNYEVIIPARVRIQLKAASAWYVARSGSTDIASTWHHGFVAVIATLATNPQRFGLAHESESFPYDVRELLYGSGRRKTHRALFRIDGRCVHLLSIRHIAQRDVTPDDL